MARRYHSEVVGRALIQAFLQEEEGTETGALPEVEAETEMEVEVKAEVVAMVKPQE